MNIRNGIPGSLTLLALLISSHALAVSERPQLRNYGSYTDFLRAVVDFTKNDGTPSSSDRECRDKENGEGGPQDKQNTCKSKDSPGENGISGQAGDAGRPNESGAGDAARANDDMNSLDDLSDTGNATGASDTSGDAQDMNAPDALEQAIAQARDGLIQRYVDNSNTRTTYSSFPMQPVDAGDLAQVSLIDALTGLMITERDAKIRLNIDPSRFTDPLAQVDSRQLSDDKTLNLDGIALQQALINNILPFAGGNFIWSINGGNYYSVVHVNPSYIDGNGLSLSFSAQASVRAAIVDSDGWLQADGNQYTPSAGAIVIDPLNIKTNTIVANLFARKDGAGNTSVIASLDAQGEIAFDLSNTSIGVASATRNGSTWTIGEARNFMAFGPSSVLSIRMNEPMETILSNPDNNTNTPLLRINGSLSQLTLSEIALLDGSSKQGIHFGRVTISNLAMVNTSVFFENDTIRVDMGKGTDNLRMTIENLVLGGTMQDRANGTLPPAIGDIESAVSTPDNMQITLRAH